MLNINKQEIFITAAHFSREGKKISQLVNTLKKEGLKEKTAQMEVFITLWDFLSLSLKQKHHTPGKTNQQNQTRKTKILTLNRLYNNYYLPKNKLKGFLNDFQELGKKVREKCDPPLQERMALIMGMLYEAFLKNHSPLTQKKYGVYSTPYPLVDFMVHSIDHLLKNNFSLPLGIADQRVFLFDPAAGTGIFMESAHDLALKTLKTNGSSDSTPDFSREFLNQQCLSLEKLPIPCILQQMNHYRLTGTYTPLNKKSPFQPIRRLDTLNTTPTEIIKQIASGGQNPFCKKGSGLPKTFYQVTGGHHRFEMCHGNHIKNSKIQKNSPKEKLYGRGNGASGGQNPFCKKGSGLPKTFYQVIGGHHQFENLPCQYRYLFSPLNALHPKQKFCGGLGGRFFKRAPQPLPVILGNPPYSVHSPNKRLDNAVDVEAYLSIDGKPLNERCLKGLQYNYIKFLRYAQLIVDDAGKGIIAFVVNNSFLDNITFRGMRHSLAKSFDAIYILNLNGNQRQAGRQVMIKMDSNIFPVRVGIAVCFLIKRGRARF